MVTLMAALGTLVMVINSIDTNAALDSLFSARVGGGLLFIAVLTAVFWRIEQRAVDPIVRPALFASGQITKSCLISAGSSAAQSGSIFLPALLVISLGVSPADSALLLLPGVVAATIAAPIFGKMITSVGTRIILVFSQVLVIGALCVYAYVDMTIGIFVVASMVGGVGSSGLVGAPIRYIVLAETGDDDRAAAQGLLSVTSSIGRLLGAALVGAVAASIGGGAAGYQAAFAGLIVLSLLILFTAMTLKSKSAEKIDGGQPQEAT
jgi:MFS family permease